MTIEKIARDELRDRIDADIKVIKAAISRRPHSASKLAAMAYLELFGEIEAAINRIEQSFIAVTASYRAGAEDMREACRSEIQKLAGKEEHDLRGDYRSAALWDAHCALHRNKLPLPDPHPTPTQESRDV